MYELLQLQFIIIALIGIGCLIRRNNMVGSEGQKNLTDLVINVILPCNTISAFVQDVPQNGLYNCVWMFLISTGIQILCIIYGKIAYRNIRDDRKQSLQYGIMVSNAGFLGNAVAEGLYGSTGLMLASIFLTPVRIMMWSEGISLFSGEKDRKAAMKKVLTHPCVVACILGIIIMIAKILTGVTIVPPFILALLKTLGRCNTGLSMLVIGMIVSRVKLSDFVDRLVFRYSIERLIVVPAIVFAAMLLLEKAGCISGDLSHLCVLLTAMPAATTTSILAARYDCAPEFAAKMVVVSTVLSIPSILLWSLFLV